MRVGFQARRRKNNEFKKNMSDFALQVMQREDWNFFCLILKTATLSIPWRVPWRHPDGGVVSLRRGVLTVNTMGRGDEGVLERQCQPMILSALCANAAKGVCLDFSCKRCTGLWLVANWHYECCPTAKSSQFWYSRGRTQTHILGGARGGCDWCEGRSIVVFFS